MSKLSNTQKGQLECLVEETVFGGIIEDCGLEEGTLAYNEAVRYVVQLMQNR